MRYEPIDELILCGASVMQSGVRPPKVSVIVVNHNYGCFIGAALASIRAQTYPHFECVVVDNGSDDGSLAAAERQIEADARFRIVRLDRNYGQVGGGMVGLDQTDGEFVAFVDADDVLFPTFLASHVQVHLACSPNVAISSAGSIEIDAAGGVLSGPRRFAARAIAGSRAGLRPAAQAVRIAPVTEADFAALSEAVHFVGTDVGGFIWGPGSANVYRRSVMTPFALGVSDQPLPGGLDAHFNHICHAITGTMLIDQPLYARRLHGTNDYVRMPLLPGMARGNAAAVDRGRQLRLMVFEMLMSRVARLADILDTDERFFRLFDHIPNREGADLRQFHALLVPVIARHYRRMASVYGERAVLRQVHRRLGYAMTARVLGAVEGPTRSSRWRLVRLEAKATLARWGLFSAMRASPAHRR